MHHFSSSLFYVRSAVLPPAPRLSTSFVALRFFQHLSLRVRDVFLWGSVGKGRGRIRGPSLTMLSRRCLPPVPLSLSLSACVFLTVDTPVLQALNADDHSTATTTQSIVAPTRGDTPAEPSAVHVRAVVATRVCIHYPVAASRRGFLTRMCLRC